MSELINIRDSRATIHWKLLTTASAVALTAYMYSTSETKAETAEHPLLWIELGGQVERMNGAGEVLSPAFFSFASPAVLAPMTESQRPLLYSNGGEAKISFTPEDSNWIFSAAIRYGRSNSSRHKHYQMAGIPHFTNTAFGIQATVSPDKRVYGDGQSTLEERHSVLDFQAGKDVGLGFLGAHGNSTISAGVRFAQFNSSTDVTFHARPVYGFSPFVDGGVGKYSYHVRFAYHQTYEAALHAERTARAVGPSLSWNASVPVVGNAADMALAIDWGVNAAILFGRQRTTAHHQTTGYYYKRTKFKYGMHSASYHAHPPDQDRSRRVTIPNVGGFAAMSLQFPNAKVSLGYRADFFINAIDGGIDTAKKENRGFYGPFASISIGLGD